MSGTVFPFCLSPCGLEPESTLEQCPCSWNCLLALVGRNQSSDWVPNTLMALQSNSIYHISCLSPLENDISQCNVASWIFPLWVFSFRVEFSLMASPFPHFVYLWEVAHIKLPSTPQMELGRAPRCPSPPRSWSFLPPVSRAGPHCLTSSCPFHSTKRAANGTQLSKFPGDPWFDLLYYPLRNVSVIEIQSHRVLCSCHLAFYFRLVYLDCASKPQSGRSLPEGPEGWQPRMLSFTQRQEVKESAHTCLGVRGRSKMQAHFRR